MNNFCNIVFQNVKIKAKYYKKCYGDDFQHFTDIG